MLKEINGTLKEIIGILKKIVGILNDIIGTPRNVCFGVLPFSFFYILLISDSPAAHLFSTDDLNITESTRQQCLLKRPSHPRSEVP